jgi:DNA-binding PucR family transcriptional regulator
MSSGVGDLLSDVAASLASDTPAFVEELVGRILREIPALGADQQAVDLLTSSVSQSVTTSVTIFQLRQDAAKVEIPAAATEYTRRLAQRGVPISALVRSYRIGHAEIQERMIRGISMLTTDPAVVAAASIEMSSTLFVLVDRASRQVEVAYQQERDSWLRNRVAVRWARVMSLLASTSSEVGDAERTLGYAMRQAHLGVIVWSEPDPSVRDPLSRLERVVGRLAEHLGSTGAPLFVASDESTVWAWLPRPRTPLAADFAGLTLEDGVWVALGQVSSGLDGFRVTHHQARLAQTVALAAEAKDRAPVTPSAQVGPIALMCGDVAALRAWVLDVLGDLAIDDEGHGRLRETLREFLAVQGSHTAVAERLGLHRNTVRYRVHRAEEALGQALESGRVDVEVALLACRWLGATVMRQPAGVERIAPPR